MEDTRVPDFHSGGRLPWLAPGRWPLYLAPMAGFTDMVFRGLCKREGADVLVSEFVMANRFLDPERSGNAWEIVDFTEEQRPMGIQIFGGDPAAMAEAARRIVERLRPDFLDLNFGCPAPKVVDNCAGSSLLKDLPKLQAVAEAVVCAVGEQVPVTAKMRIGWDRDSIVAPEAARRLEAVGIEAVTVHGRTKVQGYQGDADWSVIEDVVGAVSIPVIGNGGLETAADVARVRAESGVRGLMIGRAALGYPWIFREIRHTLEKGYPPPPPTLRERWETLVGYCDALVRHSSHPGRWDRLNWMRARLKSFTKQIPGCRDLRQQLDRVESYEDLLHLAKAHLAAHADESTDSAGTFVAPDRSAAQPIVSSNSAVSASASTMRGHA